MSENYTAPEMATVPQWSKETGQPEWLAYRMIRNHAIPHIRVGARGVRILMKPYRRQMEGKPVDSMAFHGKPFDTRSEVGA